MHTRTADYVQQRKLLRPNATSSHWAHSLSGFQLCLKTGTSLPRVNYERLFTWLAWPETTAVTLLAAATDSFAVALSRPLNAMSFSIEAESRLCEQSIISSSLSGY